MNAINQSILTWILLLPLAGAVLVAILPGRGKLPNWIALLTALATFGLTLHLPAHFALGQGGFQFELNLPWIENPAIFYHVGTQSRSGARFSLPSSSSSRRPCSVFSSPWT